MKMSGEAEDLRLIRLSEIEEHNNEQSCWIILHEKVYNVTSFLKEHPNGDAVILDKAGHDATDPFEDAGHSGDARELLPQFLIGQVHPDDLGLKVKKSDLDETSWKSWLIPVTVGVAITLVYRYYLVSRYSSTSSL